MKYRILILIFTFLTTIRIAAQQVDMAGSLNSFSFDLYKQLKSDKENLFFSPLSIDIALLMAREGARSDTKSDFEKVLHIGSTMNTKLAHDFILNLKSFKDSTNRLSVANAIWIQNNYKIKTDFQNRIQANYFEDVFLVNFLDPVKSATRINTWTSQKTNNLIDNIISSDQMNNNIKLLLTNAIYFIARWDREFYANQTILDKFYGINCDSVEINFMHETGVLNYFENNDFQFISKYYKGNDKSFCVILPKVREGISSLEATMNKPMLDSIFKQAVLSDVDLSLPKFKLEGSYSLNESLRKLGLKRAFSKDADFSGISVQSKLKINEVLHKTYIQMNEFKTEAAAVTSVYCTDGLMPVEPLKPETKVFNANHPFLFMILDTKTKGVIFMGRYVKKE